MWPERAHTLAPLTKITPQNRNFNGLKSNKAAFNEIKRVVARDTLLTYPDFNEALKIHTNASDFQLVVVISQKGKPIALYSRKLTGVKKRYTVTEKELLSTFETLK